MVRRGTVERREIARVQPGDAYNGSGLTLLGSVPGRILCECRGALKQPLLSISIQLVPVREELLGVRRKQGSVRRRHPEGFVDFWDEWRLVRLAAQQLGDRCLRTVRGAREGSLVHPTVPHTLSDDVSPAIIDWVRLAGTAGHDVAQHGVTSPNPNRAIDLSSDMVKMDGVTTSTFGQTLTKALRTRGLTQIAFARMGGWSPASVNAWIHDQEEPRIATLKEIAATLETTPAKLLAGQWRRGRSDRAA